MPILNTRWPEGLAPDRCHFGRSRNDILSISPYTRQEHLIKRGRPLWKTSLSWSVHTKALEAELRYYLDELEGFAGAVYLWDFASRQNTTSLASPTYTCVASAASFAITGLPVSATIAVRGDYMQAGRRLYVLTQNLVSDASGNGTAVPTTLPLDTAATSVRFVRAACEMRLASQQWDTERSAGDGFMRVSAEFVETVEDFV